MTSSTGRFRLRINSCRITIDPNASSFSAEPFGIVRALYYIFNYAIPKVLIITDSLSALQQGLLGSVF